MTVTEVRMESAPTSGHDLRPAVADRDGRVHGLARHGPGRGTEEPQQPVLVHPPEVVLPAVDERHRDLLGEAALELGVGGDVDLGPALPQLGGGGFLSRPFDSVERRYAR